jgi:anti-sigma regulatory factor (Ser/Thr protein kinase)
VGTHTPTVQSPECQLAWTSVAVPAAVTAARHAVLAFAERAGASPLARENLALAVSEAAANVVLHGYTGSREPGAVEIRASVDGETLHVVIADDGRGMKSRPDQPGLGLGLALMAKLSERFVVRERQSGGVELHMAFAIDER